jgi:hypothetical protein
LKSCDTCPGAVGCAGDNLVPVLSEIYVLYASGETDKFKILVSLSDSSDELIERYTGQVSRICWTKAALETIADVLSETSDASDIGPFRESVIKKLDTAMDAFANFPWYVSGLIGQVPDLYEAIKYRDKTDLFASNISKRDLVKICKDAVYKD